MQRFIRNPLMGGSNEDWKRAFDNMGAFKLVETLMPNIEACVTQGTALRFGSSSFQLQAMVDAGAMPKSTGELESNLTVYTGLGGCALTFLRLGLHLRDVRQLPEEASACFRRARDVALRCSRSPARQVSFLCGVPGAIAIAAACASLLGDEALAELLMRDLMGWHEHALTHAEDELLFGRAGYGVYCWPRRTDHVGMRVLRDTLKARL
jgi:hypothetical protein